MAIPVLVEARTATGYGIRLDALSMNLGESTPEGVEIFATSLTGWDSAGLRDEVDDRPLAHGAFRGTSFYGSRDVQVEGVIFAPSRDALDEARDFFISETDLLDRDGVLTVYQGTPRRALVRRTGKLLLTNVAEQAEVFSLALTAVDPRRYGVVERTVEVSRDPVTLPNEGTFRAGTPIRVTFQGSALAPSLTIGNETLRLTSVPAERTITVDTLEETVLFENGASAYHLLGPGSRFPVLPARSNESATYAGTGGYATVRYRPAYL